jgi:tetratricopeptide (TPR) repeat protein
VTARCGCSLLALLLLGAWDPTARRNPAVEKGNQRYAQKDWDGAVKRFGEALRQLPGEPAAHFDLGGALFQKAQAAPEDQRGPLLDEAEKEFRLAGDANDTRLRSAAHYNLGNTLFERKRYEPAIDEYKKALKLDPSSEDARHNLELAQLLLKKQPPPPQQQQGQGGQKQPQQQPQPQQPQQQQPQQQQPQQQQPQQQPQSEQPQAQPPQAQPPQPPRPQGQPPQTGPKEQQPQAQPQQGSPPQNGDDNADVKLDNLERQSKDMLRRRLRAQERRRQRPEKDW